MKKFFLFSTRYCLFILLILMLALPGCASRGGRTYSDGEARSVQRVSYGDIVAVDKVRVEDDASGIGAVLGGVAGGVLGSLIGGGSGRTLAILGGAAAGATAGHLGEGAIRDYNALQLTITLDDNSTIVVVQAEDEAFGVGDKVRVISTSEGRARVQHR